MWRIPLDQVTWKYLYPGIIIKFPQKVVFFKYILETIYFWIFFFNEMHCIVYHCKACVLFYNASLFVTKDSCRAETLPLWCSEVRKDMYQIWAQQNNPQWNWLKLSSVMLYWFGWMVVFLPMPFELVCFIGPRFVTFPS